MKAFGLNILCYYKGSKGATRPNKPCNNTRTSPLIIANNTKAALRAAILLLPIIEVTCDL